MNIFKFNVNKLKKVDENAKNIIRIPPPYYLINKENLGVEKKRVVFFGNCYRNLPPGIDLKEYMKITNECLDFIRRECAGYELYYKPHPAEIDESKSLNLASFNIEKDKTVGELYLCKNFNRIKHVFSSHSHASTEAFSLGLNSHVFVRQFKNAFDDFTKRGYEYYFGGMPESFFISDLNKKLEENRLFLKENKLLENQWVEILAKNAGKIWFIASDPGLLPLIASFTRLIKNISRDREIGLILNRHNRWDSVNVKEILPDLTNITFFPVAYFSFKPSNLKNLLKIYFAVKSFKINSGDIIFGVGPTFSFLENCFLSFFKNNMRIALISEDVFYQSHNFKIPIKSADYSIKKSRLFFIKFVEPLLGLYPSVGRLVRTSNGEGHGISIARYQDPINEVFNMVYLLKFGNISDRTILNKVWQ